jgi:hypothetical protein
MIIYMPQTLYLLQQQEPERLGTLLPQLREKRKGELQYFVKID